jgi:hypothetical protein
MRKRPVQPFIRKLIKEEPPQDIKSELISYYKSGGLLKFEDEFSKQMRSVVIEQPIITDYETKERLQWKYVGRLWWCRFRQRSKFYEFARMMALVNKPDELVNESLWDDCKHIFKSDPVFIYKGDRKGVIVGYNEFEVLVQWFNDDGSRSLQEPLNNVSELGFEFIEDFRRFSKIFSNIQHARMA